MQELDTLSALFDNKILAVLAVLVNNISGWLYLREIAKYSGISDATTYRIIKKLVKAGIVEQQKIKKLKLYRFRTTDKTNFLYNLLKKDVNLINEFVEQISKLDNVSMVLLHGKESNQRASVLIIGADVDAGRVKEICGGIKERYNYIVSPLVLTAEQFEQMKGMGLYSGKEEVLFEK